MPVPTRDVLRTATTIHGAFARPQTRETARALLDTLAAGDVIDPSGRAATLLIERTPTAQRMSHASINKTLRELETHRWITRDVRGRRTMRVALGPDLPDDWAPPTEAVEAHVPVAPDVVADVLAEDEELRGELGGRPGRFAARLARELPALVTDAVRVVMTEQRRETYAALGYVPRDETQAGMEHALASASDALAQMTERVAHLERDLRDERRAAHAARTEVNRMVARAVTIDTGRTLRPKDVPESFRALAAHALANGWTINKTNGGHLAWVSPAGVPVFGPATPSDWRSARNHQRDLEAYGLPRE